MTATTPPPPEGPPEKASETAPAPAGTPTPAGAPSSGGALSLGYAGVIAVLLVVAAVGGGLAVGTIARPRPTPHVATAAPTVAPTPTPMPTTDPAVFRQTLSSGCATEQALWVVTNGGGLLRYDGKDWAQVDGTLRTLTHASCDAFTVYAVGPVGAVLIVDDRARSINSFDVSREDLVGVAALPSGAIVVGTHGEVQLLSGGQWQPYARGIDEDLSAIVMFGPQSAWVVGSQGISYRLEVAGWRAVRTGVDVTLRAIAGPNVQTAVAVGDAGTILALSGLAWSKIESGIDTPLRAVTAVGSTVWAVGDNGVVLTIRGALASPAVPPAQPVVVERVDVGTTCALTSVFSRDRDVWIIGSRGGASGVWRVRDGKVAERWGEC